MKKLFLLRILFVFQIIFLKIQIIFGQTLTCQTSCPQAGQLFSMRTSSPVLNSPGINQAWNFSVIAAISPGTHLISYAAATSVPSATLYPQADLVRTSMGVTKFLTVGNAGIQGLYPLTTNINIPPTELPLPFAYGDNYSETIISTSVTGTDTFVTSWQNSFIGHGSGTLILPSGTFPDVLSIKFNSTHTTSKNGSPFGYTFYNNSFYYYSQNVSHPLLYTRQLFETGPADYGPYTEFVDQILLDVKNEEEDYKRNMVIFPNPSGDFINIKFSTIKNGTLLVKNSLGQQVIEQEYADSSYIVNLTALPVGIYIVSFVSDTYTVNKKLVVSR